MHDTFPNGTRVTFKAGPKSKSLTTATVDSFDGVFLVTKDEAGKERKIRPGACTAA